MLFNSIDFAFFLPIVFILYWFVANNNLKIQNLLIVTSSYIFYGWWDWHFLFMMAFTTFCSWYSGILMLKFRTNDTSKSKQTKLKIVSAANIFLNLSILGYFKYYNFFIDSFVEGFRFFGQNLDVRSLEIILPVGISFYTFQALSYSIDVYKEKLSPTKDIVSFFAFVSFFPQLVAGPIERATHLLPQFQKKRVFDYTKAVDGLQQMLWGFFKKIVIADNCAEYANLIFNNSTDYSGSTLFLGAIFFTFQIYGDFSGYSDIAIGSSRLFGIDIMRNFNFPYFSRDIAEFWRRWHISLTTWFRDYLYFPLGGNRVSKPKVIRNTLIIFVVSGFWHGANWTFIIWGIYHAFLFLPLILMNKNRKYLNTVSSNNLFPTLNDFFKMFITFILVVFGWIIFRVNNLEHLLNYISTIFSPSFFELPSFQGMRDALVLVVLIIIFMIVEWLGREEQYAISNLSRNMSKPLRYTIYYSIIFLIVVFGGKEQQFIYFQF